MRIAQINMMHNGSTGKIMLGRAACARAAGHEVRTFSPVYFVRRGKMPKPTIEGHSYFGSREENALHTVLAEVTGFQGCFSYFGTRQLLRMLDEFQPDIIHLHNLHNRTIDLPMLFRYIKKRRIRTVWTLHDCWSFTGQCPHFVMADCDRWKTGCHDCPQTRSYPKAYVDRTRFMWAHKRRWFTGVEDLTLVTPSRWLAGLVQQSWMKEYPVRVIPNGIDRAVFRPAESDFREKYHLEDRFLLMGVAFDWGERKGLDVFIELARRLPPRFAIVLVGTDDAVDRQLPENILSIHRTENQRQLAELYTAADLFVNPTREENYPTVNMEALACGTPVLTFATGGSPEIPDEHCGITVPCGDVDALENAILEQERTRHLTTAACLARAECFEQSGRYREYIALYEQQEKSL